MPLSVVLYKLILQDETVVAVDYRDPYPVVIRSGVMPVVRLIEHEWRERMKTSAVETMLDQLYLNPSVVNLGTDFENLFHWEIITDPYTVSELKLLDQPKKIVVRCDGKRALQFWESGRKPALPKVDEVIQ